MTKISSFEFEGDRFYLDGDGSYLCGKCAEESKDNWIEALRPIPSSGWKPTDEDICDECNYRPDTTTGDDR